MSLFAELKRRNVIAQVLSILVFVAWMTACVSPEVLVPKNAAVPDGVDLSGRWQLRDATEATVQRRSPKDTAVYVFLETGSRLKITQTAFGIFVSFNRSIVEEYQFGENRSVHVGPIVVTRVSGWEGNTYVIETLDKKGAKLVEQYRLEDNGSRLVRHISIWAKKRRILEIEQTYVRIRT